MRRVGKDNRVARTRGPVVVPTTAGVAWNGGHGAQVRAFAHLTLLHKE
jgi:hypothetical protein